MINILKINKPEFSDLEKIVLKMCNGEAPLYNIDLYMMYFKYENHIYGMWFANNIYGIGLYSIDGRSIDDDIQEQLKIRLSLRIKLWNTYSKLYKQCKCDLSFKKAKEFEEKILNKNNK